MTVSLRPLTIGDLDRVDELEHELFGAAAWSRAAYAEELRASGRSYVAAVEPGGLVVGYAGILLGRESEVMTVGVAASWQRRGIGALLVDALLAAARRAAARWVFLEVRAGDDGARRLYHRAGFRDLGVRRGYYQPDGEDAVVMRLDMRELAVAEAAADGRAGHDEREETR